MNAEYLAIARTIVAQRKIADEHGTINQIGEIAGHWILAAFDLYPSDPWDDLTERLETLIQAMDEANFWTEDEE